MTQTNVVTFPKGERGPSEHSTISEPLRMVEAVLFASTEPVSTPDIASILPDGVAIEELMSELGRLYEGRGVNLHKVGDAWAFRTADDLSFLLQKDAVQTRRLSKAALEVLAIIAYHQSVTRGEIEEIRGVATSRGTLDVLMETGWVRMRGRRKSPGRPVTYGTTPDFLDHFGLEQIRDLPGLDELKGSGLLQSQLPAAFDVPVPNDDEALQHDEEPLGFEDVDDFGLLSPAGGD